MAPENGSRAATFGFQSEYPISTSYHQWIRNMCAYLHRRGGAYPGRPTQYCGARKDMRFASMQTTRICIHNVHRTVLGKHLLGKVKTSPTAGRDATDEEVAFHMDMEMESDHTPMNRCFQYPIYPRRC